MTENKKKRVIFKAFAPEARKVIWKKTKILPKGTHEYKFIVDGEWTCDPNCPDIVCDAQGTENNIIVV